MSDSHPLADQPIANWSPDAVPADVDPPRNGGSLAAGVDPPPNAGSRTAELARGGVEGRRTVKIGGRPGEHYRPSERRRPPQTVSERLGPRPDRIAAWACALGFLLILIAILTQ